MSHPTFVSFNGRVTPYADAKVHIQTPLVRYGAGVFEGIAGYWSEAADDLLIFRLEEHLRRIQLSMRLMRFAEQPGYEEMRAAVLEVIRANGFREDVHLRLITWIDGDGDMKSTGPFGWSITVLPRNAGQRLSGVHCAVSSWRRIEETSMPPRLKCVANYNQGRLAWSQAQLDGYDAVLLQTAQGHIAETPMSCMFMVRDGVLVTPLTTDSILESITRETLLKLASELGIPCRERHIDRTELYLADETFLCGSGQEVTPVLSVDRHPMRVEGEGPVTRALRERYFEIARAGDPAYAGWLTPVYGAPAVRDSTIKSREVA